MASHYKLAVVTGGLFGCAVAVRVSQNGFANQNNRPLPLRTAKIARLSTAHALGTATWPEGLALHTAVLMDVVRGETLVKVTYPKAC
ncbi:MAG: hypothetical protein WBK91_00285 [Alphaproteobacteria bacterium]